MRILVVDDFVTMRKIMKNFLNQLNFINVGEDDAGVTDLEKLKSDNLILSSLTGICLK